MLTVTVCAVFSQTASSDTICLPMQQVRQSIRVADTLKLVKQEVRLLNDLTSLYEVRLKNQDSTINDLFKMGEQYLVSLANYKAERNTLAQQRDLQRLDTEYYKRLLRKQKRKTAFMGLVTALGIACTIFLMK